MYAPNPAVSAPFSAPDFGAPLVVDVVAASAFSTSAEPFLTVPEVVASSALIARRCTGSPVAGLLDRGGSVEPDARHDTPVCR